MNHTNYLFSLLRITKNAWQMLTFFKRFCPVFLLLAKKRSMRGGWGFWTEYSLLPWNNCTKDLRSITSRFYWIPFTAGLFFKRVYSCFLFFPPPASSCSKSEFKCRTSTKCIVSSARCDGRKDCHDGSDEELCNHGNLSLVDFSNTIFFFSIFVGKFSIMHQFNISSFLICFQNF